MEYVENNLSLKQLLIRDYHRVKNKLKLPTLDMKTYLSKGTFSQYYIHKGFGSWLGFKEFIGEGVEFQDKLDKEKLNKLSLHLYETKGKLTRKMLIDNGMPYSQVERHYGTFTNLMQQLGLIQEPSARGRNRRREDYIDNLLLLEHRHSYVNSHLATEDSPIPGSSYLRIFNTFGEACLEADVRHIGRQSILVPDSEAMNAIRVAAGVLNDNYYHTELTLDWIRNPKSGSPLPVDAYFPNSNLMIEYHGPQHYMDNHWHNSRGENESLKEIQYRDKLKKETIISKGINYACIYDYEKDNIEWILNNRIN